MAQAELTPEQILTWMGDNPGALRLASARAAEALLNGPEFTSALTALQAALEINQDSAATVAGQGRQAGDEGSRESLARIVNGIVVGRQMVAARIMRLTPQTEEGENTDAGPPLAPA